MAKVTRAGETRPPVGEKEATGVSRLPKRMRSRTDPTPGVLNLDETVEHDV